MGPFTLLEQIGHGGMGEIWLARPGNAIPGVPDLCVVKLVKSSLSDDPDALTRFRDESRVALLLRHPFIARVVDAGRAGDVRYLALEVVEGVDLERACTRMTERGVAFDVPLALWIAATMLDALSYAHTATHPVTNAPLGVVHRDVAPNNVMLARDGTARIIDFGLALSSMKQSQTRQGVVFGKIGYMSPEQARGDRVDAKSDVYATAIVLYELISGDRFWGGLDPEQVLRVAARGDHVPARFSSLHDDVRPLLATMLRIDPTKRATAAEARDRIVSMLRARGATNTQRRLAALVADVGRAELATIDAARAKARNRPSTTSNASAPTTESLALVEARTIEALLARDPPKTIALDPHVPRSVSDVRTAPISMKHARRPMRPVVAALVGAIATLVVVCAALAIAAMSRSPSAVDAHVDAATSQNPFRHELASCTQTCAAPLRDVSDDAYGRFNDDQRAIAENCAGLCGVPQ